MQVSDRFPDRVGPLIRQDGRVKSVDPDRDSAPSQGDLDVATRWRESRLRQPVSELSDELGRIADDAGFVVAVTDETGTILWISGCRAMRRRIEAVNFMPGGCWSEEAIGTNAEVVPGLVEIEVAVPRS